jgi:putative NADH-flavin reductase
MSMQRILVLGATGATGRELMTQAVNAGLEVTAFVRDPSKLPQLPRSVSIVRGDIMRDSSALTDAMESQHAVISTLGVGPSFKSGGLIAHAAPTIVDTMQRADVHRLVFTSAFGVGPTWTDTPRIPRVFMRTLLRDVYADKAAGENAILASMLDWTIVHPASLTNKPRTDRVRIGEHLPLTGFPTVSRADVAAVMLRLVDDPGAIRKTILVAN